MRHSGVMLPENLFRIKPVRSSIDLEATVQLSTHTHPLSGPILAIRISPRNWQLCLANTRRLPVNYSWPATIMETRWDVSALGR